MPNRYGLTRTFGTAIGAIALVVLISGAIVFFRDWAGAPSQRGA
jgi:hypothetical protein